MGIVGLLPKGLVRLIGVSAGTPAGAYAVRSDDLPGGSDAAWRKHRLERLECLCLAANAGPCCDSGPLVVAVEAMERARRRDGP